MERKRLNDSVLTLWKRTINNSKAEEIRWFFYFSLRGLAWLQTADFLPVSLICSGVMFRFVGSSYCCSNLPIHPSIHPFVFHSSRVGWGYPRHSSPQQHFPAPPGASWGSLRPEETYIIPPASSGFGRGPDILQTEVPRRYPNQMLKLPQLAPFFRCEGTAALLPAPSECRSSSSYLQARVTEAAGLLVSKFSFYRSLPTAHDCRWGSEQISTGKLKASLLTQDRQLLSNIQGIVLKFLT